MMTGRTPPPESLTWDKRLAAKKPREPNSGDTPLNIDQALPKLTVEGVRSHHQLSRAPTRNLKVGKGPSGVDRRIRSA
ncbi:MAG: hypothetical protein RSE08_04390, partial [Lactococcus sp.]